MAYLAAKTGLEYDGQHHEATMAADARRRRLLQDLGWQLIPITDHDLRHRPDAILHSVTTALARRAPGLLADTDVATPEAAHAIMARLLLRLPH
jgi:very-short-patch-repair endonuclease